jgi:putative PIN family toxin of toxin-antitoxin system
MKIVLDTNVLVSGLLSPYGIPGEIVRMVSSGDLELCFDARILSEYGKVLLRSKFHLQQTHVAILLEQIQIRGYLVAAKPLTMRLPDSDDEVFLEVALAGRARYLVTGNLKHYPKGKYQGIKIVSPKEFLGTYRLG